MKMKKILLLSSFLLAFPVLAQTPTIVKPASPPGKVIASGTVPDEASRSSILGKLRDIYGASNVVDQLEVGGVIPPARWTEHMNTLLDPTLKQVHKGELQVNGTQLTLKGQVANENTRQQVDKHLQTALNSTYSINNALVTAGDGQGLLDKTLADRVVEFESGSALLTPAGKTLLDEMASSILQIGTPKIQLIGHTDSSGDRQANITLSQARANVVRNYLVQKGIPANTLTPIGRGPDQPLTSNDTPEGRAKNRRIEFHLIGQPG